VWYPEGGHLQRTKFPQIRTFDSSATPTEGHAIQAPKAAAEIDLTEINKALAEAVREAEANDPKLLRAEIARLKTDAAKKKPAVAAPIPTTGSRREDLATIAALRRALENAMKFIIEINTKDFFNAAGATVDQAQIEKAIAGATDTVKRLVEQHIDQRNKTFARLKHQGENVIEGLRALLKEDVSIKVAVRHNEPFTVSPATARATPAARRDGGTGNNSMPKAERLILTALAQYPDGRKKAQVAVLTGYAVNGGAFNNSLGALRSRSLITRGEPMQITDPGLRELGTYDPLPVGPALLDYWMGNLGKAERFVLKAVTDAYPDALNKQQVAVTAGYEANGGAFNNALGRLRSLELIKGRGEIKASDDLFE